jgi:hypothetical protein
VERALSYPYSNPGCSFVHRPGEVREIGGAEVQAELDTGRTPLLAYGANAAPEALDRKLATLPERMLPVLLAELEGFDVVYSAHVSPYGAVVATLMRSLGTCVRVHVAYPDADQLPLLAATEPNYELSGLAELECRVDGVGTLTALDAFESRHGSLRLEGAAVALAAIPASGRALRSMAEPEILELVRAQLAPKLSLEQFVGACVERGGIVPLPPLRP